MKRKEIMNTNSNIKPVYYDEFGKVGIYMPHDKWMGTCIFKKDGFITPNMPKLFYSIKFDSDLKEENLIIKDKLSFNPDKYTDYHLFEKLDGFNVLFYKYDDEYIPKTRKTPKAEGEINNIFNHKIFEDNYKHKIYNMVDDEYIPILEVYGKILNDNDIYSGPVDYDLLEKEKNIDYLNISLIGVMKADYKNYNYNFLPVSKFLELAEKYDLPTPEYYGKLDKIAPNKVKELINEIEEKNKKYDDIITEGYVLHCHNKNKNKINYQMFKIKSYPIMKQTVIHNYVVSKDKILKELSKILLETSIIKIGKNPKEYLKELKKYLQEDKNLTNKDEKKIKEIFREKISKKIIQEIGEKTGEELGRMGISEFLINKIIKKQN
ncbi:MAG: hypothetical protein ACOCP8_03860 [archaeon]